MAVGFIERVFVAVDDRRVGEREGVRGDRPAIGRGDERDAGAARLRAGPPTFLIASSVEPVALPPLTTIWSVANLILRAPYSW